MRVATPPLALAPRASTASLGVWLVSAVLILLPTIYGARVWLDPREAWVHPELFGTSQYVWMFPDEPVWSRLRKAIDWKAFDPNVNRVRPLSDLTDTVDTIARPYLTRLVGPHPSITPSTILTAVIAPLCLFFYLRALGLGMIPSAALTGLFISSIGFLSVIVLFSRPAKKITVATFCVALCLAEYHRRSESRRSFLALIAVLFFSCFADELDLAKYPVIGLLYFRSLIWRAPRWKQATFLALPLLYVAAIAWGLPAFYLRFSVHGAWDALGDGKKLGVLRYLWDPFFWETTIAHLNRAFLTTIGIGIHTAITEGLALIVLCGATLVPLALRLGSAQARRGLAASALALVASTVFATLLDFYPDVSQLGDRSYLASFTYYYHSALAVLVIAWLAHVWLTVAGALAERPQLHRAFVGVAVVGCLLGMAGGFATWHQVNRLAHTIHLYPFATESLFRVMREHQKELRFSRPESPVVLEFSKEREALRAEYDAILQGLYGDQWQASKWHEQLETFKRTPIMKDENVEHLVHAYFPRDSFTVRIRPE
jgi:hypothetical protein